MAILSILLALVAGLLTFLGFLTAIVPVVGTVLAFSAPVAALVGLTVGGLAWSRAREERKAVDVPVIGTVMNVFALVPALLVAFTCGVCNAMVSSGPITVQRQFQVGTWDRGDGGLGIWDRSDGGLPLPQVLRPTPDGADVPSRTGSPPVAPCDDAGRPPPPLPAGPQAPPPDPAAVEARAPAAD